jgi:hypothetical protein
MSFALRMFAPLAVLATLVGSAPGAAADPGVDSQSAPAVIAQLQQQGHTVKVNGVPSGDTSMIATCVVTKIHDASAPQTGSPVAVDIACPITRS